VELISEQGAPSHIHKAHRPQQIIGNMNQRVTRSSRLAHLSCFTNTLFVALFETGDVAHTLSDSRWVRGDVGHTLSDFGRELPDLKSLPFALVFVVVSHVRWGGGLVRKLLFRSGKTSCLIGCTIHLLW
jgi:hypothetical protein